MYRSTLPSVLALAAALFAGGCNFDRPEMDDAIGAPTAMAAAPAAPQGQEVSLMFEAAPRAAARKRIEPFLGQVRQQRGPRQAEGGHLGLSNHG